MNDANPASEVVIELDATEVPPGGTLRGRYRLPGRPMGDNRAVEVSALWLTEGKGTEDLRVHHFDRSESPGDLVSWSEFRVTLPLVPMSYEGVYVKIRWFLRVRVFTASGQRVGEAGFTLGSVRPATMADDE